MSEALSSTLERGKACLRCRRRKMKCDGSRPICGPCTRAGEPECEFTLDGPALSQVLEQQATDLEARIRELEERLCGGIQLYDPRTSTQGTGAFQADNTEFDIPTPLLASFLDLTSAFGFFLNLPRFLSNIAAPTQGIQLPPVLLHTMKLVGLVGLRGTEFREQESHVLSLAIESLSSAVSNIHPEDMLYILQAEVLLSQYFFHQNRSLEGGLHVTAAVSMILSSNLHQIRNFSSTAPTTSESDPAPFDEVQAGERINAFWTVLTLDGLWSSVLGQQSALSRECFSEHIYTPWPLDMVDYEQGQLPQDTVLPTINSLLSDHDVNLPPDTVLAKRSMAAVLFSKTIGFVSRSSLDGPGFHAKFMQLDSRIDRFKRSLVLFTPSDPQVVSSVHPMGNVFSYARSIRPKTARCLLLINLLAQCATIKLYSSLPPDWNIESSKSLASVTHVVDMLKAFDVGGLKYVDPFVGVLLSIIVQSLISTLEAIRTAQNSPIAPTAEAMVKTSLEQVLSTMEVIVSAIPGSLFVSHSLQMLRERYPELQIPGFSLI